jgi:hypothetical protein
VAASACHYSLKILVAQESRKDPGLWEMAGGREWLTGRQENETFSIIAI